MSFISKKQLVPTNANHVMVFICEIFQSSLQVGQLKSYGASIGLVHIKMIAVFITRVQCSSWQKPCSAKYVVGNAGNNSFTFTRVLENAHCT